MAQLVTMDLDGPGANYVNSRLKGGGVISRSFLKKIGPVDRAYSPLPDGVGSGQPFQFEHGGITTQRATLRWLVSDVASKFPTKSGFCFLVEDSWAKPTDSSILDVRQRVFFAENSVIYAIAGEEFDTTGLTQILRSVSSFDYMGFVVACPLSNAPRVPSSLNNDTITELVEHIRFVLVSAFDREGLVISDVGPKEGFKGKSLVLG